jgi:hypothetical protein
MAGFTSHIGTIDKRFTELSTDEKKHDDRVSTLETAMASLDISIVDWKLQVEESYFNGDANESNITKSVVLSIESALHHPRPRAAATYGPSGTVGLGVFTPIPISRTRVRCNPHS